MTIDIKNTLTGRALYLEFERPGQVTQILIMPEGRAADMAIVPMTTYRRRLTIAAPKKNWRQFTSSKLLNPGAAPTTVHAAEQHRDMTRDVLSLTDSMYGSLINANWKIVKRPLVVEVSAEDLLAVRRGNTPYKVIGRIMKTRKSWGFPDKIIPKPAATV